MSFLSQGTYGKKRQPIFAVLYGRDGWGKSYFVSKGPNPAFIGTEKGTASVDGFKFPPAKTLKDVFTQIDELTTLEHSFQTLGLDSLDWLEPLVFDQVIEDFGNGKIRTIEDFGYGKGYAIALDYWRKLIAKLEILREKRGMHIVLIGHAIGKPYKDPQHQMDYNRFQLKLNDKAAALLREAVDYVLFANFETNVFKDEKKQVRAFGDDVRLLFSECRPGFDAKSRTTLPFEMVITKDGAWNDFYSEYLKDVQETPEQIITRIKGFTDMMPPETLPKIEESIEAAKTDAPRLELILNRVRQLAATMPAAS